MSIDELLCNKCKGPLKELGYNSSDGGVCGDTVFETFYECTQCNQYYALVENDGSFGPKNKTLLETSKDMIELKKDPEGYRKRLNERDRNAY